MSSDVFERNISKLVRHAALPADDAARKRARAGFLRAAEPTPKVRSWGLAAAAALLLIAALIYGSVQRGAAPTVSKESPFTKDAQDSAPTFIAVHGNGGDHFLKGALTGTKGNTPVRTFRFQGRCTLPEGVCFQVLVKSTEQRFQTGRLVEDWRDVKSDSPVQQHGAFECEWQMSKPGRIGIGITIPESAQEMSVVDAVKRVPEPVWRFDYDAWDDALLLQLDPQLAELADLAREARDLVHRVEAASPIAEQFRLLEKALTADARRLEARAKGMANAGLYPAAAHQIEFTAASLAGSIAIFQWKDGKFDGPSSYYTAGKREKTFRGDLFDFDALRRYLDEAVVCAGREFDLWIVRDFHRAGLRPALIEAVTRSAKRPGVAEFAERLKSGPDPALADEIRQIAK